MKSILIEQLLQTKIGVSFFTEFPDNSVKKYAFMLTKRGLPIKAKTECGWFVGLRSGETTKLTKVTLMDNQVNE